jgi:hypothetical protein
VSYYVRGGLPSSPTAVIHVPVLCDIPVRILIKCDRTRWVLYLLHGAVGFPAIAGTCETCTQPPHSFDINTVSSHNMHALQIREHIFLKHTVYNFLIYWEGTQYRSWSRHCATSQKVVGWSPNEDNEFFNLPYPLRCTRELEPWGLLSH